MMNTLLRHFFTIILINAYCESHPDPNSLNYDELSFGRQGADAQYPDNHRSLDQTIMHRYKTKYQCYQCEPPEQCAEPARQQACGGALSCYKSSVRDADGAVHYSRGCLTRHDDIDSPFSCQDPHMQGFSHAEQVIIRCCRGDMCNDGSFPELPPFAGTTPEPPRAGTTPEPPFAGTTPEPPRAGTTPEPADTTPEPTSPLPRGG